MGKKKKISIISGAVLFLILAVSSLVIWRKNDASENEGQNPGIAKESGNQAASPVSKEEQPGKDGLGEKDKSSGQKRTEKEPENIPIKSSVSLQGKLNLTQEVNIEQEAFPIYENTVLTLDQAALDRIIDNLVNNQWGSSEYKILGEGAYLITSGGQAGGMADKDKILEIAQGFLQESGLSGLLEEHGMEYELELTGERQPYTAFCYILCDKERTGSYIRMIFEDEKICAECMMYLYKSRELERLSRLPIEEALTKAFYMGEETGGADSEEYNIQEIGIKYVNGLPFYHFLAYGVNNRKAIRGFALAVSIEESANKPEVTKKYSEFAEIP